MHNYFGGEDTGSYRGMPRNDLRAIRCRLSPRFGLFSDLEAAFFGSISPPSHLALIGRGQGGWWPG